MCHCAPQAQWQEYLHHLYHNLSRPALEIPVFTKQVRTLRMPPVCPQPEWCCGALHQQQPCAGGSPCCKSGPPPAAPCWGACSLSGHCGPHSQACLEVPFLTEEDGGVHACWRRKERALKHPGASHISFHSAVACLSASPFVRWAHRTGLGRKLAGVHGQLFPSPACICLLWLLPCLCTLHPCCKP